MSSGTHGIAHVAIKNGEVTFLEVWGVYSPSCEEQAGYSTELRVQLTEHGPSWGNIHAVPRAREVSVYLTAEQLADLTQQLIEYRERLADWQRAPLGAAMDAANAEGEKTDESSVGRARE